MKVYARACTINRMLSSLLRVEVYPLLTLPAGIRSFGAADEQKAVVEFYSPLTLITGQNGAGKTV